MTVTLVELATATLYRLGDTDSAIWAGEIEQYIQQGYDELTKLTGCLLGVALAPDYAMAFTITEEWEGDYVIVSDDHYINGPAQFTAEFERDLIDNADGPANHNYHWEFNNGYVDWQTLVSALVDLPEDLHEIERAVWNTKRIEPLRSQDVEWEDSRYELNKGQVESYLQDKDGIGILRKWRVPSTAYTPYSFDADSDDGLGILRDITDIIDLDVISYGFGDLVQVDGVNVFEDYGILGPIYKEQNNVRIEYRRRGATLSDSQNFEIPDRYTTYVRHYAMARALEREGDGQDLELSAHYQARYEAGLARMKKRKHAMFYQKELVMGSASSHRGHKPPRPRLPYNYGRVVR